MPRRKRYRGFGKPAYTVVIDWDGTAVPSMWPERPTEFMPGFVEACRDLHEDGFRLVIQSARLNPHNAFTGELTPEGERLADEEAAHMRAMLDAHGLTYVAVWNKRGKPTGFVYVDDRAERYGGRPNSWAAMVTRIQLRAGREDPQFPAYEIEGA